MSKDGRKKVCVRCLEELSFSKFKWDKRRPDGRTVTCRECYKNRKLNKYFRTSQQIESQRKKILGRKYSAEHRLAISNGLKRSVKDPDYLRERLDYADWKEKVKIRDGNKCTICGSNKMLHVHHIKCFYSDSENRLNVDNGMTLCISCHMKLHNPRGERVPD